MLSNPGEALVVSNHTVGDMDDMDDVDGKLNDVTK